MHCTFADLGSNIVSSSSSSSSIDLANIIKSSPFAIWVNLRMLLSTSFFGGFTIPGGP